LALEERGLGREPGPFFAFAADAVSKAAWRSARAAGDEAVFSSADEAPVSVVVAAASEVDFAVAGVLDEPGAGALAGVVVIEVGWVATVPTASLSSPNSFHSST
jgi:hypothetical protein